MYREDQSDGNQQHGTRDITLLKRVHCSRDWVGRLGGVSMNRELVMSIAVEGKKMNWFGPVNIHTHRLTATRLHEVVFPLKAI